jgi:hypothetical protein
MRILNNKMRACLIFYTLNRTKNIIIWDLDKNKEYKNFASREEDNFQHYITGEGSDFGYIMFDKY